MNHTKGKWTVEISNVQTENRLIANCIGNGSNVTEEDKANAKLISCAPELLNTLITAEDTLSKLNINAVADNTLLLVRNAIKSATE